MGHLFLALFNPLFFASLALAYAAYSLRKLPRAACLTALAVLLFFSSGAASNLILKSLEGRYEGQSVQAAPQADVIVVLGGYVHQRSGAARPIALGGAADRLWCAAELFRGGKAPIVLLSGGSPAPIPEAMAAREILLQWGVPASAILTETASRDTHQNAVFSQRILTRLRLTRILLVTSATHMPRAAATFRRTGREVVPFASDFISGGESDELLPSLLPSAGALANSTLVIKEWLGIAVYRIRGWAN